MSMMFEDRKAYDIAVRLAVERLGDIDPAGVAAERGVSWHPETGKMEFELLGETVSVDLATGAVTRRGSQVSSGAVAVIALHYLTYRGEPLAASGGYLAYRDMPGGRDFSRAFESMSERPLGERFGLEPEAFDDACRSLGGAAGDVGEHSFVIEALPRMKLLVVLWPASEAEAGASRILFPPSAPYYLHTEDLAALGVVLSDRLIAT